MKRLNQKLQELHKRPYGHYRGLKGVYHFNFYTLVFEHIQGDPYAPPSRYKAEILLKDTGFPEHWIHSPESRLALGDFLTRKISAAFLGLKEFSSTGGSGKFRIPQPGPQILKRSTFHWTANSLQFRFVGGLPANNRAISGDVAIDMFINHLPDILCQWLVLNPTWQGEAEGHIQNYLEQLELFDLCKKQGLIAFVPNGALLPRESSRSTLPLAKAVPFRSPQSLEKVFKLKNGKEFKGMGLHPGIHLVVGGGFHGKTTLLEALQAGVYPHISGDGREFVFLDPYSQKIQAENGRHVHGTDISPFIHHLPQGWDASKFYTQDASGSTSQAAGIVESLWAGVKVLLLDEDTCATNFMIRDEKMRMLISERDEPITPFIDRVKGLYEHYSVSTILVMGGVGDYFPLADTVIALKNFKVEDVTQKAHQIAKDYLKNNSNENSEALLKNNLKALPSILQKPKGIKITDKKAFQGKWSVKGLHEIQWETSSLSLRAFEQLVCVEQVRYVVSLLKKMCIDAKTIDQKQIEKWLSEENLGSFNSREIQSDWAEVRLVDVWSLICRLPLFEWEFGK